MAESNAGNGNAGAGNLRYDDIVARVIPDPAQAQRVTLLCGYVGKGDAGRVRIYPDLSFSSYYDVGEADVVHSVAIPAESSALGGSYVWVKAGADVKTGPADAQAGFAAGGPGVAADIAIQTHSNRCVTRPPAPLCVPPYTAGNGITCLPCRPPVVTFGCIARLGAQAPGAAHTQSGTTCPVFYCPPPTQNATCHCTNNWNCPTVIYTCTGVNSTLWVNCPQHPAAAAAGGATSFCAPTDAGTTCPQGGCDSIFQCGQTQSGNTCPSGDCTFFNCVTQVGDTCPSGDCTFFGCPTRLHPCPTVHVTCPGICHVAVNPGGVLQAGALQPTPTAALFHMCGVQFQAGGAARTGIFNPFGG